MSPRRTLPRTFTLQDFLDGKVDIDDLPLSSLDSLIDSESDGDFAGLCRSLVGKAGKGRKDALMMLFGAGYLYRNDIAKMHFFVDAISLLDHPEVPVFLASEMCRVKSTPANRTYLSKVLSTLLQNRREESEDLLIELMDDPRIGPKYRQKIKAYFNDSISMPW